MTPLGTYVLQTVLTLVVVLALCVVVLVAARRVGVGASRGPVQLVGRLPLDGRRAVYLVKVGGQVFVIGGSEAGLEKLGELPADAVALLPDDLPPPRRFASVLQRVLGNARNGGS